MLVALGVEVVAEALVLELDVDEETAKGIGSRIEAAIARRGNGLLLSCDFSSFKMEEDKDCVVVDGFIDFVVVVFNCVDSKFGVFKLFGDVI